MTIYAPGFSTTSFEICKQSGNRWYRDWEPLEIFYDRAGNLYVLANYEGFPYDDQADDKGCIWKFSRGEPIILDPNSPNSLIPGGIPEALWDFSVGENGDVVAKLWENYDATILSIRRDRTIQTYPVPPAPNSDWCPSFWNFAVDCKGTIYTTNDQYGYGSYDCGDPVIYTVPGNVPLLTIPSDVCGQHYPAVDGYGNIYILGDRRCNYGDPDYPVIRRILPEELPAGYYDCFSCCPQEDETCNDGVGDINECEEEGLAIELITNTTGNTEAETSVCFNMSNPPATIDVLFGDAPIIKFHKKDCLGPAENVNYTISELSVTPELGIDAQKSLFPTQPAIFFATQIGPPVPVSELQFQSVHTGSFEMTITPIDTTISPITVIFNIIEPTKLGTKHNNYDTQIIKYADKYGIPPQYIKAQVGIEALKDTKHGIFLANSFRYEPISWDIARVSKWTENDWVKNGSDMWAFKYPLGYNLEGVWDKINQYCYGTITIPQDPVALPVYTCTPYSYYPEDNMDSDPNNPKPVRIVDVYNFNNGWADGSYPKQLYRRPTVCPNPCVQRQGWDRSMAGQKALAYHNYQYYCGTSTVPEADCCKNQEAIINWLMNLQNYDVYAQIPVCSSYGLIQVMYFTAIQQGWRCDSDPTLRKPEELLDVDVNIDVAVGFDASNLREESIESSNNQTDYENNLKAGFKRYNKYKKFDNGNTYGEEVKRRAKNFKPQS